MFSKDFRTKRIPKGSKNRPHGESPSGSITNGALKANLNIRKYVEKTQKLDKKERWLSYPEIPTAEEIMGLTSAINQEEGHITIEPNNIDEPWESREEYLSAHYELLREDSVALLRDAVAYLREDPSLTDTHELCVYEKVRTVFCTFNLCCNNKYLMAKTIDRSISLE